MGRLRREWGRPSGGHQGNQHFLAFRSAALIRFSAEAPGREVRKEAGQQMLVRPKKAARRAPCKSLVPFDRSFANIKAD